MKMKKQICFALCLGLLVPAQLSGSQVYTVEVQAESIVNNGTEAPKLEQVLPVVKRKITIPSSYTFVSGNYYEQDGNIIWNLIWSKEDSSIEINCDQKGNIIYFRNNSRNDRNKLVKPIYLIEEAEKTAENFLKRTVPDISGKLKLVSASGELWNGAYTFSYQRIENGIMMPDNNAEVTVNYETNTVESFSCSWLYNAKVPSKEVKINKQQAAEEIAKSLKLNLMYQSKLLQNDGKTSEAELIYRPDKNYISINAVTKEVYNKKETFTNELDKEASSDQAGASKSSMTEDEIKEINKLKKLITKDHAIKKIRDEKMFLLEPNAKFVESRLQKQGQAGKEKYIWYLTFYGKDKKNNQMEYAYASVNAANGMILTFGTTNYYDKTQEEWNNIKIKYNIAACEKISKELIQKQASGYADKITLTKKEKDTTELLSKSGQALYGGFAYEYTRSNSGVLFPENMVQLRVDGSTGKIYQYNVVWDEAIQFDKKTGILSAYKAMDRFLEESGFNLMYEINTIRKESNGKIEKQIRLVYSFDKEGVILSAQTGKKISNMWEQEEERIEYSDLDQAASARKIKILADLGIGFTGGKFLPKQTVKETEYKAILNKMGLGIEAKRLDNNQDTDRMTAVRELLYAAGFGKIASLSGIYKTGFSDEAKISETDIGYAALAKGLGIIKGDAFRPKEAVTREELMDMLYQYLTAQI